MLGSGCIITCGDFTQNVPPASSLPDHASNSAPAVKPKHFACAEQSKGKNHLYRACVSRIKSYMCSLRAEFTAQPSLHVISASSPFFAELVGT